MKNTTNAKNASKKQRGPDIDIEKYPMSVAGFPPGLEEKHLIASRMYGVGYTYQQVADKLGVCVATARKYVVRAREAFIELAAASYQERLASVYQDLDTLKYEAYAAWEASKGSLTKTVERTRPVKQKNKNGEERANAVGSETTITTTQSTGNPQYLAIVARVLDRKAQILGLEKEAEANKGLASFLAQPFDQFDASRFLHPSKEDLPAN